MMTSLHSAVLLTATAIASSMVMAAGAASERAQTASSAQSTRFIIDAHQHFLTDPVYIDTSSHL